MTVKAMFTKLTVFLAVIALILAASFGSKSMMNTAALAEDAFSPAAEADSLIAEAETVTPETEEAEAESQTQEAEAAVPETQEPEAEPQTREEEAAVPETQEPEAEPQTQEEEAAVPETQEPEAEPQPEEEAAVPETEEPEAEPQTQEEEAAVPETEEAEIEPQAQEEEAAVPETQEPEAEPQTEEAEAAVPETQEPEAEPQPEEEAAVPETEETGHAADGNAAPDSDAIQEDPSESGQPEIPSDGGEDSMDDVSWNEEELVIMEDDDAGYISEEVQMPSGNPSGQAEFAGTAEIRLMNEGILNYGDEIVLKAEVRDVNLSYRLVWEANDNDGRGWLAVGYGETYRFVLDQDNAGRDYRVIIMAVD